MATFERALAAALRLHARYGEPVRVTGARQPCTCPLGLRGGHVPSPVDGHVYEYFIDHTRREWHRP